MRVQELGLRAVLAASLAVSLGACERDNGVHAQGEVREQVRERLGPVTALDTATAARLSNTFRAAADRALPAVVQIAVVGEAPAAAGRRQVPEEMRPWLEQFGFQLPEGGAQPPRQGSGSGFVIDAQGHIMTNHHVVNGATRIMVRFVDGREYDAELVGSDENTDVAIIRITPRNGEPLPVSTLGNSDETRIGDWVLALGNPLGLDFSVTAGIVSAKGRTLRRGASTGTTAQPLEAYIQTDAAINPGNSGGPLVDLYGRVIGMNTAISAQNFIGHGFAVPINLAQRIATDLLERGFVRRPRIGVTVTDVEQVDAEVYGLPNVRGAEVTSVAEDGPARDAGLRPGDVVLAIDGREIRDATDLTTTLAQHQPGDQVVLTVWRDRQRSSVRVRLAEFERPRAAAAPTAAAPRASDRVGFTVLPVTAQQASRLGLPAEAGLVIDEVTQFGPADGRVAPRSTRTPMLLRSVNGRAVKNVDEFEAAVGRLKAGDAVSLRVVDATLGEQVINYRLR